MRPLKGAKARERPERATARLEPQVYILNDSLQPLPPSEGEVTGLLGVAGPQVTPGYVERGEHSEEKHVRAEDVTARR